MSDELISQLSAEQLNELNEILLNTQEQCQMAEQLIKNQIEVKDQLIDKLHKELEYYKQDAAERFTEQLMRAVIKVRRDMRKNLVTGKLKEMTREDLEREYRYTFDDLTDLLEQQNVDEYETREGELFDPARHKVARVEPTTEKALDKRIKASLSEGYIKGDKVIVAERVIAYQYRDSEEVSENK